MPGQLAVFPLQQPAGRSIDFEDQLVAGDDQPFVEQLQQRQIQTSLRALRHVGNEAVLLEGVCRVAIATGWIHDSRLPKGT